MSQPEHPGEAAVSLFEDLPAVQQEQAQAAQQTRKAAKRQGAARLLQPNRSQIELRASDLESLLGEDHLARLVWGYVERQDLSRLIEVIKARGEQRRARCDRPAHPVCAVAVRGTERRGQRARGGAPDARARCLPLGALAVTGANRDWRVARTARGRVRGQRGRHIRGALHRAVGAGGGIASGRGARGAASRWPRARAGATQAWAHAARR